MTKMFSGLTRVFITLFISIVAMLGILAIFGAIDTDTLTESSLKIGAALLILTISSFLISWLQDIRK